MKWSLQVTCMVQFAIPLLGLICKLIVKWKIDKLLIELLTEGSIFVAFFFIFGLNYLTSIEKQVIKIWIFYLCMQQIQSCGSLVTEEHPYAMLIPIELFLMGFGFYRQPPFASSSSNGSNPTSPCSHACIAPELLSPESLGIKLKPIKTRATMETWCMRYRNQC